VADRNGGRCDLRGRYPRAGGGAAVPARPAGHSRCRHLHRCRLSFGPVEPRRGSHRQTGRGDRHRCQRRPVHASDPSRGRPPDGVPAVGTLRRPQARPCLSALASPAVPQAASEPAGGQLRRLGPRRAADDSADLGAAARQTRRAAVPPAVAVPDHGPAAEGPAGAGLPDRLQAGAVLQPTGSRRSASPMWTW
jgi:hypothetical protein